MQSVAHFGVLLLVVFGTIISSFYMVAMVAEPEVKPWIAWHFQSLRSSSSMSRAFSSRRSRSLPIDPHRRVLWFFVSAPASTISSPSRKVCGPFCLNINPHKILSFITNGGKVTKLTFAFFGHGWKRATHRFLQNKIMHFNHLRFCFLEHFIGQVLFNIF